MAEGGISIDRHGRFARLRAPGQDHLFRIDKLVGGSVDENGVELLLTAPLDRLTVPCPDAASAAELWRQVCGLAEEDAQHWRDGQS
jgi:hypothetical protein